MLRTRPPQISNYSSEPFADKTDRRLAPYFSRPLSNQVLTIAEQRRSGVVIEMYLYDLCESGIASQHQYTIISMNRMKPTLIGNPLAIERHSRSAKRFGRTGRIGPYQAGGRNQCPVNP